MRTILHTITALALTSSIAVFALPSNGPQEKPPVASKPALPAIAEVDRLKLENAMLRARAADQQYRAVLATSESQIRAVVDAFEVAHPGFTIDTAKLVAVAKPPAK